MITLHCYHRK